MKKIIFLAVLILLSVNDGKTETPKIKAGVWKTLTSERKWQAVKINFEENNLNIKFKNGTPAESIAVFVERFNFNAINQFAPQWHRAETTEDIFEKIKEIKGANVSYVENLEPNMEMVMHGKVNFAPNDTLYGEQWHFINAKIVEALDKFPAGTDTIVIGLMDTGYNYWFLNGDTLTHDDLWNVVGERVAIGKDFSSENETGFFAVQDNNGHGTFTAGEMTAITNNITGVASPLDAYPIKIYVNQLFSQNGGATIAKAVECIYDLVDQEVNIIELSGGGPGYSFAMEDAIAYCKEKGVKFICSSGNEGYWGLSYPARLARIGAREGHWQGYNNVINTGYTNKDNLRSTWSSIGPELICVAPGEKITSTWKQNGYYTGSGSSFSAPLTATLVAMMLSHKPDLQDGEIKKIITETAQKIGPLPYEWDGYGHFNPEYGYGMIDFEAAMEYLFENYLTDTEQPRQVSNIPSIAELKQNYPNPFNARTIIEYSTVSATDVEIEIYDVLGQIIGKMKSNQSTGNHKYVFNNNGLPSGIYFYRLKIRNKTETRKMILIK